MNFYIPMEVIWCIVICLILSLVLGSVLFMISWIEEINSCIRYVEELKEKNKKLEQQYKLLKKRR